VGSNQLSTQRRRSERVSKTLPVIVRGIDLLGQPFEERTSTLSINLHGCRYSSTHHLPKNTWITLEIPRSAGVQNVRARVAWIQRPHSTREFFQVAVELETPGNVWEMDSANGEGASAISPTVPLAEADGHSQSYREEEFVSDANSVRETYFNPRKYTEETMTDPANATSDTSFDLPLEYSSPTAGSPLFRELSAELRRQAKQAVEAEASATAEKIRASAEEIEQKRLEAERLFEAWREQFLKTQEEARADFAAHLAEQREELRGTFRSSSEIDLEKMRELMQALDLRGEALRAENEAATEAVGRMAQARLQAEAAEAMRSAQPVTDPSKDRLEAAENAASQWRERLRTEMAIAQAQWDELLQSSLDSNMQRLAAQLSAQSQSMLRSAEEKITERFAELRQPLIQMSAEARESVAYVKAALEEEVSHARNSLADIEHSGGRVREYSAQLEAANHDTLNELHRRLESILETQTEELNRRAERLAAGLAGRVMPELESLTHQFVEKSVSDVEAKLTPQFERVPELIRELGAREMQVEEGLRLHRERLRQLAENNQRDVSFQLAATLQGVQGDFEAARKEALVKWNEELDASGVRASHAASETIGRASEWFQQEARARLQVLVEQSLVTAGTDFEERTNDAAQKFTAELEAQSSARLNQIQEQLSSVAGELTCHTRSQLAEAAQIAAASFGQVVRGISQHEAEQFTAASRDALYARTQQLEEIGENLVRTTDERATASFENYRNQIAAHLQSSVMEGRSTLTSEFQLALDKYRAERDAHEKEWAASLDRLTREAGDRYQERLESTCDAWTVASVRRLNEHGQNAIESLMRSADQSLRESCSRVFDGLSEMLRGRTSGSGTSAGFAAQSSRETPDAPHASQ
jgi:hypothetical protein